MNHSYGFYLFSFFFDVCTRLHSWALECATSLYTSKLVVHECNFFRKMLCHRSNGLLYSNGEGDPSFTVVRGSGEYGSFVNYFWIVFPTWDPFAVIH